MVVFTGIGAAAFGAGTFLATVTAGALQVAAGIALSLVAKAIAGEPQGPKFGVQVRLQGGDDVPRSIILGYTATAGSLVYANTWGTSSGVPNAYITQVIALADYPIQGLLGVEVNGIPDTLAMVAHPDYGRPVLGYRKNGVDHLWVKFYDGMQTTADPFLTGTVSSTERPYPSTRVGRGVPYVIVTAMAPERKDGEDKPLFSNGVPQFKFVVNGAKLYDPSRDSTVGGTGTQRANDPATWGGDGDFLPMVQAYNLLRGIRFNGQWVYGLQSLSPTRLPVAKWIAEINKCRAPIAAPGGGTEPTYRSGGEIQVGAQVKTAIETLLTSCQGRLSEVGGTYIPHVGEPPAAVMTLTDANIISTQEQMFTPFYGLEDTINGIQATYPNPAEGWKSKTAPPLYRTDLEVLDGNRRLMANVSFDMVPYTAQVQRLMLSALREAQRARRHTFVVGPEYWVLEPGDVIEWTSERNGYISKLMRVDGIADRADLDIMLDLTEVDPSDYDWNPATDFRPVIDGPLQLVDTPALPMIGWQVYGVAVKDELGRDRRPGIEVWYQSGLQNVESVRVQVRVPGATNPFIDLVVPYGSPWRIQIPGNFPPNTEYQVRGIFVLSNRGRASWSAWLSVVTPDIKLTAGLDFDPYSGVVGFDQLDEDLDAYQNWIGTSARDLYEQAQELAVATVGQELANSDQFKTLRHELGAVDQANRADWLNEVMVLASKDAALAQEITTLAASLSTQTANATSLLQTQVTNVDGKATATANALTELSAGNGTDVSTARFRMATQSGPSGYSRIGAQTRVDVADPTAWRGAAWYLDTPNDPLLPTRFLVEADQFIVVSGGLTGQPLVFQSGVLSLNVANIGTVFAGRMQRPDGTMVIDLNNKEIYMEA